MSIARRKRLAHVGASAVLVAALCGGAAGEAKAPATRPATRAWGTDKAGVQVSLAMGGEAQVGGAFPVDVAIRNVGAAAVSLPRAKRVFAWLFLVQETPEGKQAFYTDKLPLAARQATWPAKLRSGKELTLPPCDIGGRGARRYVRGLKVIGGYPAGAPSGGAAAPPPRALKDAISPGRLRARMMLYLPRDDETPLLLVSNTVTVAVAAPDFASLSAAEQRAFGAKLIGRFDRDAFSARDAHGEAVRIGPAVVPYLVEAVRDRKRAGHSRLWLATALADIRCEASAAALIRLLRDPSGGVRSVVGYHGPKQRSAKLDEAILARIPAERDAGTISYTLLGFLVHRERVPEKLLAASFESTDPKVRATVAAAMKGQASDFNVSRLVVLLGDKNERVRAAAAKALGAMKRSGDPVLAALVRCLQAPGDYARKHVADALGELTGRKMPYDADAPAPAKRRVVQAWRDWWAARSSSRRGR